MELRAYLLVLWRERAIVLLCTVATLFAAYVFTLNEPETYEATASFVMRPRAALVQDEQESVRVLDTLGRHVSIGSTYIEVASSQLIRQRAIESLSLSADQRRDLKVDGQVLAGTNMLKITVEGTDPTVVRDFANQIGVETVEYVSSLYDIFELEPLDAATTPRNPVKPNLILNLILGVVLGMGVGTAIALFTHYWRTPHTEVRHFDIVEPQTGAYNLSYFQLRLNQEVSRSRRTGEPFSLALIRVASTSLKENDMLRRCAIALQSDLPEEDLLAYAGDSIFALLLVGMTGESAKTLVQKFCSDLQTTVLTQSETATVWDVKCSAGVSCYEDVMSDANDVWTQAVLALDNIGLARSGKVNLYSQLEGIFEISRSVKKLAS